MVELTVPYESRMEEAHTFKEGKCLDLTKELKKDGYEAKVMPIEIGARGFVGSSAYGMLEGKRSRGKQREKLIEGLTDWLKAGKSLEAIEATKDRKKWKTMIANAVKQGT
ncbi:reverse transcriptase [Plakobranchus ocellatus]|uniref:Reverse transcriptase n=1 Tax=Plakobranchus ocellatus TaxID=259542 RepID=A0AAV4CZV0_9GAST|nr:reverse transcriptase [Plakobranchus ocellatus]